MQKTVLPQSSISFISALVLKKIMTIVLEAPTGPGGGGDGAQENGPWKVFLTVDFSINASSRIVAHLLYHAWVQLKPIIMRERNARVWGMIKKNLIIVPAHREKNKKQMKKDKPPTRTYIIIQEYMYTSASGVQTSEPPFAEGFR